MAAQPATPRVQATQGSPAESPVASPSSDRHNHVGKLHELCTRRGWDVESTRNCSGPKNAPTFTQHWTVTCEPYGRLAASAEGPNAMAAKQEAAHRMLAQLHSLLASEARNAPAAPAPPPPPKEGLEKQAAEFAAAAMKEPPSPAPVNYKGQLSDLLARMQGAAGRPAVQAGQRYEVSHSGPLHAPVFVAKVAVSLVDDRAAFTSEGEPQSTAKAAEQDAARSLLVVLERCATCLWGAPGVGAQAAANARAATQAVASAQAAAGAQPAGSAQAATQAGAGAQAAAAAGVAALSVKA